MRSILVVSLFVLSSLLVDQEPKGWELFEKVKFSPKYFEEAEAYFDVPTFNEELKALEKTEVTLTGHYIPLELDSIFMLSALPFSSCFFCGGAGPETVAEIQMEKIPALAPDQIVKVKGRLRLNDSDINHMNFILEDSKIIK
ncbi:MULTISPECIES: hypothetical protein [Roseivirga]|jgi:hypothetical protein|uniref:hypothetical protein n=1 Tax=Roseivirga TaxID=290180 RepID=UPI000B130AB3|nr:MULTISPECIES: hypothetical protein [Roseivirga]PWL29927.1 MAG: hypothetical protein DCO95_08820 [Roseivirga sp. XM-24bin3]MBO6493997.1 hypothetical protein [Roseivirga sp.]MBO6661542.1 hypothetical protein [Roseivirga sp.]MBO6759940.1 hypothetical protein [Roseivirga sp.]MBO6908474.1 hypothetical protein [Roseivirga sp.]